MRSTLLAEGKSPATINRYMAHMRFLLRYANSEWGKDLKIPPFRKEDEPTGRTTVVSKDVEAQLVEYFTNQGQPLFANLLQVLADTGMRLGEALRKRQLCLEQGQKGP
jgi:integrase